MLAEQPGLTKTDCNCSFPETEKILFVAFDSVELKTIRRFAAQRKRWMMAYINGLTVVQREQIC